MNQIRKIMCFCEAGIGTSFILEKNVKKALGNLGIRDIYVGHTTRSNIKPGIADLLICSEEMLPMARKAGKAIGITNMFFVKGIEERLQKVFEEQKNVKY